MSQFRTGAGRVEPARANSRTSYSCVPIDIGCSRDRRLRSSRSRFSVAVVIAVAIAAFLYSSRSADASAVPSCSGSELSVKAVSLRATAGHLTSEFAFVNTGHEACMLVGFPRLQMLNAAGRAIATTDRKSAPGAVIAGVRARPVVLPHGKHALFAVEYADSTGFQNLVCPTAAQLRITPPLLRRRIILKGRGAHIAPYGGGRGSRCGLLIATPVFTHGS